MRSISLLLAAGAAFLLSAPGVAGEVRANPRAVVELFTSQGCSSCPKADAMFNELGKRSDVVALAWHVDYWDYIGWPDTFGAAENSDRQRGYAEGWGSARTRYIGSAGRAAGSGPVLAFSCAAGHRPLIAESC